MTIGIHTVSLGVDNVHIIRGDGTILIDGGVPKKAGRFAGACEKLSMKPGDVGLMVLTHGHWDHIGSAAEIKEMTGAQIAMHARERACLEEGAMLLPSGVTPWGKLFLKIMGLFLPLIHVPTGTVDVVLGDGERSLADYGIPGSIISTPGHSRGSLSVLLKSGDAFVGDLAMNGFPLRFKPGLPILAEDMREVRENWKRLLKRGAERVYPAHGKPFSADVIRKALV